MPRATFGYSASEPSRHEREERERGLHTATRVSAASFYGVHTSQICPDCYKPLVGCRCIREADLTPLFR